jgi:ketosteroid isomerase-like protein
LNAWRCLLLLASLCAFCGPATAHGETAADEVRATETAFAATMAARDLQAFSAFVDPEAVFFSGPEADRGQQAVVARWAGYFEGDAAPFSWAPEVVEVLDSGDLALSSGPVYNPAGERVATFTSIWRRHPDGRWLVVFDKGASDCPAP